MYVRYKKNIQENDLPRKRVRKASKIAGSGGQYLEIRCPERGRKHGDPEAFGCLYYLEIRCPERGRKRCRNSSYEFNTIPFGNKMPREGTETTILSLIP